MTVRTPTGRFYLNCRGAVPVKKLPTLNTECPMLKFLASTAGIIFLVGLVVIIGLLMLIF